MAARRSPGTKPPTAKEATHAAGVRAEKNESDIKAVLEAVTGMRQELGGKIHALDEKLSGQIEVVQDAVRTSSSDIKALRAEVRQLSTASR